MDVHDFLCLAALTAWGAYLTATERRSREHDRENIDLFRQPGHARWARLLELASATSTPAGQVFVVAAMALILLGARQ